MYRFMKHYRSGRAAIIGVAALLLAACASATVEQDRYAAWNAPKPDVVVVYDFDVTPNAIVLDKGIAPQIARELGGKSQSQEEAQVGRQIASALSDQLVDKLNGMGIRALHAGPAVQISPTTLAIRGYFLHADQGDQNLRTVVGFGLGGSQVITHVVGLQNSLVVAEGYTRTDSSLKPGLPLSAVGGGASLAIGAGTTVFSETVTATIQADAKRTADKLAERIQDAYVTRGWLPR